MTGISWSSDANQAPDRFDLIIIGAGINGAGVARDAAVRWMVANGWNALWHAPIAAETYDGVLNDINGELVRLYRCVRHHLDELVRQFRWR